MTKKLSTYERKKKEFLKKTKVELVNTLFDINKDCDQQINEIVDIRNTDQKLFEERIEQDKKEIKILKEREDNYIETIGNQTKELKDLRHHVVQVTDTVQTQMERIFKAVQRDHETNLRLEAALLNKFKIKKEYERLELFALALIAVVLLIPIVLFN